MEQKKYKYNGKEVSQKELLELLQKINVTEEVTPQVKELYVYVFDKEKHLDHKDKQLVKVKDNGSLQYNYKISDEYDSKLRTKSIKENKLSTKNKLKPCKYSGWYQLEFYETKEEIDFPYLGGTHLERRYKGQEEYIDGIRINDKLYGRDQYKSEKHWYQNRVNGVIGPRYEFYSLEPLEEKDFEEWQSDQQWLKIKKFDEMKVTS